MDTNYYKKYEPIFNTWYIKELLGEGSFGKVFEIERQDFGTTYKAALKAITIPQSQSEVKSIMADGMDEASATSYFRQVVEDIVSEFVLMSKLKGNSNIVSYEDHIVEEHKEGIGWDILIRMELLTPLIDHVRTAKLARKDIIKLGIDMCKALELCQKYNIIHRDIKPENIFISENGDYKLGDFGIARTVEKTTSGLSKKGTYVYMAPEIYKGEVYGSSVDLYSLGIVMYRLLNENRTPFLPAYPAPITHNDRESAVMKRVGGSAMPKPVNAEGRLAEIVLKACAYKPKDRYSSPMQMREELEAILYNKEEAKVIYPKGDDTPIKSIEYIETGAETPEIGKADKTDSFIDISEQEDSTDGGTEGVFKDLTTNKTDSVFDSKHRDLTVNKTESDIDSSKIVPSTKIPFWKNKLVVGGLCAILLIGGIVGVIAMLNSDKNAVQTVAYDSIGEYEDGLAVVRKGSKCGVVDEEGKEIIPIIYDNIWGYGEGVFGAQNGKWGFIDTTGKEVVPFVYDSVVFFVDGLAQVEKSGKWGFVDKTGNEVVACMYDAVKSFKDGTAEVTLNTETFSIDTSGNRIGEPEVTPDPEPEATTPPASNTGQLNQGGSNNNTRPSTGGSSNNNSGIQQQTPTQQPVQQQLPTQEEPPPQQEQPPAQQEKPSAQQETSPQEEEKKPPKRLGDFDKY